MFKLAVNRISKLVTAEEMGELNMDGEKESECTRGMPGPSNAFDEYTRKKASQISQTFATDPTELSRYLTTPTIEVTADPLEFWEINKHEYPRLYKVLSTSDLFL